MHSCVNRVIRVGARSSPLSRAQVLEVQKELQLVHAHIVFETLFMTTTGDRDQTTSLRTLQRTDFFTKEIDQLVLQGDCHIAIHSAKDLPVPLPAGLKLICLTQGVDPVDVLVLSKGTSLENLPSKALIGTSSERREEAVKELRPDLHFCDIRGTIEQRLAKLTRGEIAGVVIAEAALIRLGLTHLHRIRLPGPTAEGQGQLAITARTDNQEMEELFRCIDAR